MSRKSLSLFTVIISGLALIACNNGCTTASTIASESITISTNGGNVQVTGRVIDYRHSKSQSNDIFDRKISHSYGLCFDLNYGTFEQKEFYHEGVDNPDAVSLDKELKRVQVEISKDQNHIGLGIDGKVVEIIHLYKSNRIYTEKSKLNADGTMDWAKLDLESFPSPQSILTESLKKSCGEISYGADAMTEFCNSSKPSSKIHQILLDKWPSCSFATNYFTDEKIQELSKSEKWRKYAIKTAKKALKNNSIQGLNFNELAAFIEALDSDELNEQLDELLLKKWGRSTTTDFAEILVDRIEHKKTPLDKEKRKIVYQDAKAGFAQFMSKGNSDRNFEAENCLKILSALGDTTTAYHFIQNSFGSNVRNLNFYEFVKVAYDDFGVFTDYQQQQIIQKTEATFEHIEADKRSTFFGYIRDVVDCSMLSRLLKRYPKDLESSFMPIRCE